MSRVGKFSSRHNLSVTKFPCFAGEPYTECARVFSDRKSCGLATLVGVRVLAHGIDRLFVCVGMGRFVICVEN